MTFLDDQYLENWFLHRNYINTSSQKAHIFINENNWPWLMFNYCRAPFSPNFYKILVNPNCTFSIFKYLFFRTMFSNTFNILTLQKWISQRKIIIGTWWILMNGFSLKIPNQGDITFPDLVFLSVLTGWKIFA